MTEYEPSKDLDQEIEKLLNDKALTALNPIREHDITIFSLLRVRTDSKGEHVEPKGATITCARIPAPYRKIMTGDYLIIADYYYWTHADGKDRDGTLYHALCHINVENTKNGLIKVGTRKPEIQLFHSELVAYGARNEIILDMREALKLAANESAKVLKSKM
jgi:Putative phage metallopeptidase